MHSTISKMAEATYWPTRSNSPTTLLQLQPTHLAGECSWDAHCSLCHGLDRDKYANSCSCQWSASSRLTLRPYNAAVNSSRFFDLTNRVSYHPANNSLNFLPLMGCLNQWLGWWSPPGVAPAMTSSVLPYQPIFSCKLGEMDVPILFDTSSKQ